MQTGRLGTLVGFAIQVCGGGTAMIWPNERWIGILIFAFGVVTALVSTAAWFRSNYRARLPWTKREEGRPSEADQPPLASVASPTADWDKPLEKRFRIHFKNEAVLIDGFEFIECSFENVTFKYQGTRPFRFTGKNTGNSRRVTTDDKVVGQTLTLPLMLRPDLGIDYELSKTGSRPSYELTDAGNIFHPPTVTQTQPKLESGLYVGEIRFSIGEIKNDRHTEITMRVFNGTGRIVEFVKISGRITFKAPNSADPALMGELPTPAARPDMNPSVHHLTEWLLIFTQRVPATEADKIVTMLERDIPIHLDLSGLEIEVKSGEDRGKLPLWGGVSYSPKYGFGRIIHAVVNIGSVSSAGVVG